MSSDLKQLLGSKPSSPEIHSYITRLASASSGLKSTTPEVKSYPDAVYFNYYALGLSLLFKPVSGYTPKTGLTREDLQDQCLVLDGIDIYNDAPKPEDANTSSRATNSAATTTYKAYPVYPISLSLVPLSTDVEGEARPISLDINPMTTGKDYVLSMGEPDRKGGGAGPSSGSINIWCEWAKDGVMVEFAGADSRGPQAWERGKDAVWKVISIFPPKTD